MVVGRRTPSAGGDLVVVPFLTLGCVVSAGIAVLAGWGLLFDRENIRVTEAVNFGSASAEAAVSYVGILLARRLGGVTIRGLFDQPSLREERSGRRGRTTYAISFFMPVTDDHRYRFPVVPVEFRTTRHPQFLRAGQEVVVRGRPHRGGYLVARSVRSALQA